MKTLDWGEPALPFEAEAAPPAAVDLSFELEIVRALTVREARRHCVPRETADDAVQDRRSEWQIMLLPHLCPEITP